MFEKSVASGGGGGASSVEFGSGGGGIGSFGGGRFLVVSFERELGEYEGGS